MTQAEFHEELRGLMDSLDDHITRADAAAALRGLADEVESGEPWTTEEAELEKRARSEHAAEDRAVEDSRGLE